MVRLFAASQFGATETGRESLPALGTTLRPSPISELKVVRAGPVAAASITAVGSSSGTSGTSGPSITECQTLSAGKTAQSESGRVFTAGAT